MEISLVCLIVMLTPCAIRAISIVGDEIPDSPILEDSAVTFKVEVDDKWSICLWQHDDVNVCEQYQLPGGGIVKCAANETKKGLRPRQPRSPSNPRNSNPHLSGGTYEEKACKLEFERFQWSHSGRWKVIVSKSVPGDDYEDARTFQEIYSTRAPRMSFGISGPVQVAYGDQVTLICAARLGRPSPEKFRWTLNGIVVDDRDPSLGDLEEDTSEEGEYGSTTWRQSLSWKAPGYDRRVEVRCEAIGDYGSSAEVDCDRGEKCTAVVIQVTKGGGKKSLSGGWIAFIVIMCLLLIVVVACLVFLIWTGRLVCWCLRRDKARESRKTKRKAKDFNSQTISTQTPSTVEQKYQRRLNEAEVHVEVPRTTGRASPVSRGYANGVYQSDGYHTRSSSTADSDDVNKLHVVEADDGHYANFSPSFIPASTFFQRPYITSTNSVHSKSPVSALAPPPADAFTPANMYDDDGVGELV